MVDDFILRTIAVGGTSLAVIMVLGWFLNKIGVNFKRQEPVAVTNGNGNGNGKSNAEITKILVEMRDVFEALKENSVKQTFILEESLRVGHNNGEKLDEVKSNIAIAMTRQESMLSSVSAISSAVHKK